MDLATLVSALTLLLLIHLGSVSVVDGQTLVYLEQGRPGKVPCPQVASKKYRPGNVLVTYWHYNTSEPEGASAFVSKFYGRVSSPEGVPQDQYSIDANLSLVIDFPVSDSVAGIYACTVTSDAYPIESAFVLVAIKATPKGSIPRIVQCQDPGDRDCEVECDLSDAGGCSLTCEVSGAKPAVEVKWTSELATRSSQELREPPGSAALFSTYTTSASILLPSRYRCEAYGVALGDKNGSYAAVTVRSSNNSEKDCPVEISPDTPDPTNEMNPEMNPVLVSVMLSVIVVALIINIMLCVVCVWVRVKKTTIARREHVALIVFEIGGTAISRNSMLSTANLMAAAWAKCSNELIANDHLSPPSHALMKSVATCDGKSLVETISALMKDNHRDEGIGGETEELVTIGLR